MVPWNEFQGILIAPSTLQYTQNERKTLQEEIFSDFKGPVISLDYESDYFDTIMLDDAVTMQKMTEHLVNEHCYTDIAFLSGPLWHAHAQRRLEGYKRGLEACNIPYDETKVFEGNFWYGGGQRIATQMIRHGHLPPGTNEMSSDKYLLCSNIVFLVLY